MGSEGFVSGTWTYAPTKSPPSIEFDSRQASEMAQIPQSECSHLKRLTKVESPSSPWLGSAPIKSPICLPRTERVLFDVD